MGESLQESDEETQKSATDENPAPKSEVAKEVEPKEGMYNSSPKLDSCFTTKYMTESRL